MDPKYLIAKSGEADSSIQKSDLEAFNYGKNAPPNYNKATDTIIPPNSSTLFRSIKYVKDTANGSMKLLKKFGTIFFCSATVTLILFILMAIPIIMISVGSIYIKECPIQKMIPIWLIVFGALSVIKNLSTLFQRLKYIRNNRSEESSSNTFLNVFDSFIALFLIIWFVCGNIWVYSNFLRVQHSNKDDTATYCSHLTYLLAFWIINSIYILIALACLIFCCTICFTIFLPTKK